MAVALGEVECRSVEEVEAVAGYEAVVVGSAIHNQAWLPPALLFFTGHARELAKRPVWAFSRGMADALPRPFRKRGAALQQERLARVLVKEVRLRGHEIFSGVYKAGQMPAPLRMLFRVVGGRFGDFRDWAAVDGWTDQITDQITRPASSPIYGHHHGIIRSGPLGSRPGPLAGWRCFKEPNHPIDAANQAGGDLPAGGRDCSRGEVLRGVSSGDKGRA
jgi:menaquinone-dependent protoporphyrinogen oxidase